MRTKLDAPSAVPRHAYHFLTLTINFSWSVNRDVVIVVDTRQRLIVDPMHRSRISARATALLLLAGVAVAAPPTPLTVARTTPGEIGSQDTVLVTFDRPVAGALDYGVDPTTIVRLTPAVNARIEWRDPVTLRVIPRQGFALATRYSLRVATAFRAMDGSALASPFTHTFRVRGPTLESRIAEPLLQQSTTPRFTLQWSHPVSAERVRQLTRLVVTPSCGASAPALRVVQSAAREIVLESTRPLPLDCTGTLVVPRELDASASATAPATAVERNTGRWAFRVHGALRLIESACDGGDFCPTGGVALTFSTPVSGAQLARALSLAPKVPLGFDTTATRTRWAIDASLRPRTVYAAIVDTSLRDVFGQRLTGNNAGAVRTTGYPPSVSYTSGRVTVERKAFGTFPITTVNIDTLQVTITPIPREMEGRLVVEGEWGWEPLLDSLSRAQQVRLLTPAATPDRARLVSIPMPTTAGTLFALRARDIRDTRDTTAESPRIALVQVTDLAVHAKIGDAQGGVWVTSATDGTPVANAQVALHDQRGAVIARATSDANGIAMLANYSWPARASDDEEQPHEGHVSVTAGADRAVLRVYSNDPDLAPWRFGLSSAWGSDRTEAVGAVFTERGIYRPGEPVYVKAIIRRGGLGALTAPAAGDSLRWIFRDRDYAVVDTRVARASAFGTADATFTIPADAPVGSYTVDLALRWRGTWLDYGSASYRVAEYRPPEFLVDLTSTRPARVAGDSLVARVEARYLFGAPMGAAGVEWEVRRRPVSGYELAIPGVDGWSLGDEDWAAEMSGGVYGARRARDDVDVIASGTDTLGLDGALRLASQVTLADRARAARVSLITTVADINRQTVGAVTSMLVHPAAVTIAARSEKESWFWSAGQPQSLLVAAVAADGSPQSGVQVRGALVRREWHTVRRVRRGVTEEVGEWVADTVARCVVTTRGIADAPRCALSPTSGGIHSVIFTARDAAGRSTTTAFVRWVVGADYVPWSDESQLTFDAVADKARYAPGDTATILFATPFSGVDGWITVEREGVIAQQRVRVTSGTTLFKLPITEAHAPNIFVSMLLPRARSAKPGTFADPGRPTVRIGYTELRVTPDIKRMQLSLTPDRNEYRPGDSARVAVRVSRAPTGQPSEVTLWAVDEGVLSLTGFTTPDPLDLLYQPRGVGIVTASTLVGVVPQVPAGEKGFREPGGGGGGDQADILRSRFQTTAFFLGSLVTDAAGNATARVRLPDNLTTFRVMAVAVTAGDRYGSGQSPLLVTRPIVARPALPRFVRPGDQLLAGTLVNLRSGARADAQVKATASGGDVTIAGASSRTVTLERGRGAEARFDLQIPTSARGAPVRPDSIALRFDAQSGAERDAVRAALPVRPDGRPTTQTVAAVIVDSTKLTLVPSIPLDPSRSMLQLSAGASPVAAIRGLAQQSRVYPYACTEQISSSAMPLVALRAAARGLSDSSLAPPWVQRDLQIAVRTLLSRQRSDGGIGYWSSSDWTTAWLSAYAGQVLLDARSVGIPVDTAALSRLTDYLRGTLERPLTTAASADGFSPVARFYAARQAALAERVAAADFLSRARQPMINVENELVLRAAQLAWEDRARLAWMLARRGGAAMTPARSMLSSLWRAVRIDGARAVLPDSAIAGFYFPSKVRPAAWLLSATLAIDPTNANLGALVQTVTQQTRAAVANTQELGPAIGALAEFERRQRAAGARAIRVEVNGRVLFADRVRVRDTLLTLRELASDGAAPVTVRLRGTDAGPPLFLMATLTEVPRARPVTPLDRGIIVERWYESFVTGKPVTSVAAGDLVRVRVRVTVPRERSFVVVDDALPGGLEPVDLSLRTAIVATGLAGRPLASPDHTSVTDGEDAEPSDDEGTFRWGYGRWDGGFWTPFEHRELRDDRVYWSATQLWAGTYTVSYVARASTPGVFVRPPAHAEEMYNPAVYGRSDGGVFTVTANGR
jgi:alpha-2-macroglobulin